MSDDLPEVQTALAEQAEEIIDKDTDWAEFTGNLDVGRYRRRDSHPDWCDGTPFRPMFLAYLWATVEDESLTGIPERLKENPELARAFGFEPGVLPSKSTFKPSRLKEGDGRFSELSSTVERSAEQIRHIAARCGSPIGFSVGKYAKDGENTNPSERTIDRHLRREGRTVLEELSTVAIPSISLPRPENAIYDSRDLLELEALAAIRGLAANDGGKKLGDHKNPVPDLDDPFYEDGPSGEVLLEAMKEMTVDEIATMMNFALQKTYTRAKPRLRELEHDNGSRFGTRAEIAMDITYVGFHGDSAGIDWIQGAPDDKKYDKCFKFATAVIVGENSHFVVGVCPLGSEQYADTDAYPGKNRSYYVGEVARHLLAIADEYVDIRMVYADREFHATDVIHILNQKHLNYIIPAKKDKYRIGPICDRFDRLKRGYDEPGDVQLHVVNDFVMHGSVKNEVTKTKVSTNLVVLPPDEDDETHKEGSPQPFFTNLEVSDEISLDRRYATRQIERYSNRAAIEASYSSIKKAGSWTTSKEIEVRWFHFAFGCLVYNMWLLVDFLTQERIGVIATRKKPRISLSRFLDWLSDEVGTLI